MTNKDGRLKPDYPATVKIYEVGPRDGLQSEKTILHSADKVKLIEDLADCGVSATEVSSFVRADKIPQLADAEEVFTNLRRDNTCQYSALIANRKGLERAINCDIKNIALLTAASDTFCQNNINCSISESIERIRTMLPDIQSQQMRLRVYISCAFDCAWENAIDPASVVDIINQLADMGCDEIALADTTGKATPIQVTDLIGRCLDLVAPESLSLHLHDSYGQALANALAGLQAGIVQFDTSIAGIGGCNFSPGASGNLATEDLVFMLQGMGIETGIKLDKLVAVGNWLSTKLGHGNGSQVGNQLSTRLKTG